MNKLKKNVNVVSKNIINSNTIQPIIRVEDEEMKSLMKLGRRGLHRLNWVYISL